MEVGLVVLEAELGVSEAGAERLGGHTKRLGGWTGCLGGRTKRLGGWTKRL